MSFIRSARSARFSSLRTGALAKAPRSIRFEEQNIEEKKSRRFVRLVVFFVSLVVIGIGVVVGWVFFSHPKLWSESSSISFLFAEERPDRLPKRTLSIFTIDRSKSAVTIVALPDALLVDTLRGYGEVPASSLLGLREMENLPDTFPLEVVRNGLGVDVRAVIRGDALPTSQREIIEVVEKWNFLQRERYELLSFVKSLRKDQVSIVDGVSSQFFVKGDDGAFRVNPSRFDPFALDVLADVNLRKEGLMVSVVNASGKQGQATKIARALMNMGVDVIQITQTPTQLEKPEIVVSSKSQTTAVVSRMITRMFPQAQLRVDENEARKWRADIVIFISD